VEEGGDPAQDLKGHSYPGTALIDFGKQRPTPACRSAPITLGSVKARIHPVQPSRKEFLALAKEHTLVPVCRTLTPTSKRRSPLSCARPGLSASVSCWSLSRTASRWAATPSSGWHRSSASCPADAPSPITEGKKVTHTEDDIFAVLRNALGGHKPARLPGLPPFTAGAVGFFSYDAVRQDRAPASSPRTNSAFPTLACSSSTRYWPSTTYASRSGWWSPPTSPAESRRRLFECRQAPRQT